MTSHPTPPTPERVEALKALQCLPIAVDINVARDVCSKVIAAFAEVDAALDSARSRVEKLEGAIKTHHDQRADDRCQLDDQSLYAAAGLEPADVTLPPREKFLANCARFYDRRCVAGDWPSYQELEARLQEARKHMERMRIAGDALAADGTHSCCRRHGREVSEAATAALKASEPAQPGVQTERERAAAIAREHTEDCAGGCGDVIARKIEGKP